jgi:hypothetical protein
MKNVKRAMEGRWDVVEPAVPHENPRDATEPLRSPIRPSRQEPATEPARPLQAMPAPLSPPVSAQSDGIEVDDPKQALAVLRRKIIDIANEFARGSMNRAQFYALYKRYMEQRTIIERLMQRNPTSDAWKQVLGVRGHTTFLRAQYQAQVTAFGVYALSPARPLLHGGRPVHGWSGVERLLRQIDRIGHRDGQSLGRRMIAEDIWLILAVGAHTATAVIFQLEPSLMQARQVRDLHADFERANHTLLMRDGYPRDRLVFPQRSLLETEPDTPIP